MTEPKTLDQKCIWRDSLDKKGTSFTGNYTVKCQSCDGYKQCFAYIPLSMIDRINVVKKNDIRYEKH